MSIHIAKEAIRLAELGITVIPTKGKIPTVSGYYHFKGVTRDQINEWVGEGRWHNLAMVCGEVSGNICVIDFDGTGGYDLFKAKFPELVNTKTVATGSGMGYHVYFKCDLLPDSIGFKNIVTDDGEKINIEFRANNCLVTLPPSIHPETNKPYTYFINKPAMQVSDLSAPIAWAKSLKPEIITESIPRKRESVDAPIGARINPKLASAVENYFMAQPHKINKEWIVCSCPNGSTHKHGDKNFSFSYNPSICYGNCFGCGGMYLKDILPLIGIKASDFGGFYEDAVASAPQEQLDRMPAVAQAQPPVQPAQSPTPTNAIPVVKRSKRLTHYIERLLDEDAPVEHPPVLFPLKALHCFGGMAQVIKPGKLVGIVGISGGGKTSLLETMVDGFLGVHASCLIWSPEWTADEFIERSVQRYGGPTASEVYLHEVYIHEKQNGIKDGVGRAMSDHKINAAKNSIKLLRRWTDEVGYLDMPFLTVNRLKSSIADTLASIDFTPRVLVIDYVQLFHALEPDHNVTMYSLIMQIKAICQAHNMIGVIASQVTKLDTKGQNDGKLLDASSARYVNDDAFNLFVTINPDYDSFGEKLPHVVLNVAKNSMGKQGKMRVEVNWAKLAFSDEAYHTQPSDDEEVENKEKKIAS